MTAYTALPSAPSEEALQTFEAGRAVEKDSRSHRSALGNNRLLFWTCFATAFSTALSIYLFWKSITGGYNVQTERTTSLRRPSTYIGLDQALANTNHTPFPPFSNFPQMVYQISISDPLRKMSENTTKSWRASRGTIYPDARRIYVTHEVSTIIQFRHMDYGMERCSLRYSKPPANSSLGLSAIQGSSVIDIWGLSIDVEISRHIGDTWRYAPPRLEKVASIPIGDLEGPTGTTSTSYYDFRCRSNEFSTFELACNTPTSKDSTCYVDFWQDQRSEPRTGIYLVQEQTA